MNRNEGGFGAQKNRQICGIVSILAVLRGDGARACDEIVFFEGDVVCGLEVEEDGQCGIASRGIWRGGREELRAKRGDVGDVGKRERASGVGIKRVGKRLRGICDIERAAGEWREVCREPGGIQVKFGAETGAIRVGAGADLVVYWGVAGARVHGELVFRHGGVHLVGGFLPECGIIADDGERQGAARDRHGLAGGAGAQHERDQERKGM